MIFTKIAVLMMVLGLIVPVVSEREKAREREKQKAIKEFQESNTGI